MGKEHYGEEGGWSIPNKRKFRFIVEGIEEFREGKILDLGCGVGNLTAKLHSLGFDIEIQNSLEDS